MVRRVVWFVFALCVTFAAFKVIPHESTGDMLDWSRDKSKQAEKTLKGVVGYGSKQVDKLPKIDPIFPNPDGSAKTTGKARKADRPSTRGDGER